MTWDIMATAPPNRRILLTDEISVDIAKWAAVSNSGEMGWLIHVGVESGFNYYNQFLNPTGWQELPDPQTQLPEKDLEKLGPKTRDIDVANTLADYLLWSKVPPNTVWVKHSRGNPPTIYGFRVDRRGKGTSRVTFLDRTEAKHYIVGTLMHAYAVSATKKISEREYRSIANERWRIHKRMEQS